MNDPRTTAASSNADNDKRRLVRNERVRLTATFVNISAAGSFVTGCIAQVAPILYGAAASHSPDWQRTALTSIALACALHLVARWIIGDLKP